MIAAGKIRATDGAVEKAVAGEHDLFVVFGENDVSESMARTVANFKTEFANIQDLAVFDVACGSWRIFVIHSDRSELMRLDSHHQRLLRQSVVQILLVLMDQHLGVWKLLVHKGGAADMIEMTMRQDNST